jgi:hypothetical protein
MSRVSGERSTSVEMSAVSNTLSTVQRHVAGDGGARRFLSSGRAVYVRALELLLHEPAAVDHRKRVARRLSDGDEIVPSRSQGGAAAYHVKEVQIIVLSQTCLSGT